MVWPKPTLPFIGRFYPTYTHEHIYTHTHTHTYIHLHTYTNTHHIRNSIHVCSAYLYRLAHRATYRNQCTADHNLTIRSTAIYSTNITLRTVRQTVRWKTLQTELVPVSKINMPSHLHFRHTKFCSDKMAAKWLVNSWIYKRALCQIWFLSYWSIFTSHTSSRVSQFACTTKEMEICARAQQPFPNVVCDILHLTSLTEHQISSHYLTAN